MKKLSKIAKIYNNKELKEKSIEQQDIVDKIEVMHQQITRFENMSNSPTIFFLVKYANALGAEIDVILKGDTQEITFNHTIDEVPDDETFNVKLSGVPYLGQYENYFFHIESNSHNLTDCNNLIITNNREFTKGRLKIEIYSNKTGKLIGTQNIRLGGIL